MPKVNVDFVPEWAQEAACKGMNPDLFAMLMLDDEAAAPAGGSKYRLSLLNKERVASAQMVCETCPIKRECVENATPADLHWTVRGGQAPAAMFATNRSNVPSASFVPEPCRRGHYSWEVVLKADGTRDRRCTLCTMGGRDNRTLTLDERRLATAMLDQGASPIDVAEEFRVPLGVIEHMMNRRAKGEDVTSAPRSKRASLTEEQAREIRQKKKATGRTNRDIAGDYGVSESLIANIIRGKAYITVEQAYAGAV